MDYEGGGGGGGQRVCWPPSQIIRGGAGPPAPPLPSSYAYVQNSLHPMSAAKDDTNS